MEKVSQELIERAVNIELSARFQPLFFFWAAWNSKTMSGDDFADEVGKMFPEATRKAWRKKHPIQREHISIDDNDPLKVLLV